MPFTVCRKRRRSVNDPTSEGKRPSTLQSVSQAAPFLIRNRCRRLRREQLPDRSGRPRVPYLMAVGWPVVNTWILKVLDVEEGMLARLARTTPTSRACRRTAAGAGRRQTGVWRGAWLKVPPVVEEAGNASRCRASLYWVATIVGAALFAAHRCRCAAKHDRYRGDRRRSPAW